jgi:hypothetical protein
MIFHLREHWSLSLRIADTESVGSTWTVMTIGEHLLFKTTGDIAPIRNILAIAFSGDRLDIELIGYGVVPRLGFRSLDPRGDIDSSEQTVKVALRRKS